MPKRQDNPFLILLACLACVYSAGAMAAIVYFNSSYVHSVPIPIPAIHVEILEPPQPEPVFVPPETAIAVPLQRISAYNAHVAQTDGDPFTSSCGPNLPGQIAVSRDLLFNEAGSKYLCGRTATIVTSRGEVFPDVVVWDTMNARYTLTADILMDEYSDARAFGITTGTLYIHD